MQIKKTEDSAVEITGEIPADAFEAYRAEVLNHFKETLVIDGFRKGHVPEKIVLERVGEMAILEEMAEHALRKAYPEIIESEKIQAIGRPEITITKIASGNPLGFTIKQSVMPEVTLPDYKAIAKKVVVAEKDTPKEVGETDVTLVLENLRNERKGMSREGEAPELNDAFAQSLGEFKTLDELKTRVKENLEAEARAKSRDKRRIKLVDAILEQTKLALPEVMITRETEGQVNDIRMRIENMGRSWAEYLEHIKKTEEDLKNEARPHAEKHLKTLLVLNEIAKEEKVSVPKEELEEEIKKVLNLYQGADEHATRHYVEEVMRNEQVFKLLEEA